MTMGDVVFLKRRGVRITATWFQVDGVRYAVAEIAQFSAFRRPRPRWLVWTGTSAGAVAMLVGVVTVLLTKSWFARTAVLVLLLGVLGVTAGVLRANPHRYVLRARCAHRTDDLFESSDLQFFNQVCRALNRARDNAGLRPALATRSFAPPMDAPSRSVLVGIAVLVLLVVCVLAREALALLVGLATPAVALTWPQRVHTGDGLVDTRLADLSTVDKCGDRVHRLAYHVRVVHLLVGVHEEVDARAQRQGDRLGPPVPPGDGRGLHVVAHHGAAEAELAAQQVLDDRG
jgi:hypothetical protein